MVKDLIGAMVLIWQDIWHHIYDSIHLTDHQKGDHGTGAAAFGARPSVVESVVVADRMYGVIYGAICPTIYGSMAPIKSLATSNVLPQQFLPSIQGRNQLT